MPAPLQIAAGTRSALVRGQVRVVVLPADISGRPREALVLLDESGAPRAYLNLCRHLPIPLDSGGRRFLCDSGRQLQCATHGARFRLADGYCTVGPCAGERLHALTLRHDGDRLSIELA